MKKGPVMMFAVVMPGLGQMMQGRWVAGTIFLVLMLGSFTALMTFFFSVVSAFYKFGFTMEGDPGDMKGQILGIIVSFFFGILVYIVSLVDIALRRGKKERAPDPD
jgi:hypothetical protein